MSPEGGDESQGTPHPRNLPPTHGWGGVWPRRRVRTAGLRGAGGMDGEAGGVTDVCLQEPVSALGSWLPGSARQQVPSR